MEIFFSCSLAWSASMDRSQQYPHQSRRGRSPTLNCRNWSALLSFPAPNFPLDRQLHSNTFLAVVVVAVACIVVISLSCRLPWPETYRRAT